MKNFQKNIALTKTNTTSSSCDPPSVNVVGVPEGLAEDCTVDFYQTIIWQGSCPIQITYTYMGHSCPGGGGSGSGSGSSYGSGSGSSNIPPPYGAPTITIPFKGNQVDPTQELKCFNKTQTAKFTIFVQQPNPNTRNVHGPNEVGHTFIGIEQNGIKRYLGFYPDSPMASLIGSQNSEIHDNSTTLYHVSLTKMMTTAELTNVISYIKNYPQTYDLNNFNCTDFAIEVAKKAGITLPKTKGSYNFVVGTFNGHNPGDLGEDIRTLTLPTGVTRNMSGGNSPQKTGTCN
ncbi:hypothetical protein GCM10023231_34490 [Olivibacter ginsenosidimutans]|uniref:DUF4105 domain-containing protein n=1 Tax=Olivibacter ginsenosidimutans TaxID=1176537 RepID=A0ABP9C3X2_9SPHI